MRLPRIYLNAPLLEKKEITLEGEAFQHLARVLRAREGDEVILFNGTGGEFTGTIRKIEKKHAAIVTTAFHNLDREPPLRWELAQGISRGERMDYTVQKAVELGVAAVHPIEMSRSVVKLDNTRAKKRRHHWQGIAASACEQSGRTRLPEISAIQSLSEFLAHSGEGLKLTLDPQAEFFINELEPPRATVTLLVGPEGGLDEAERFAAKAAGFVGVRLGPRILRTETAALVAAAVMLARWGDLNG